jgi:endonuclease G, mitochondrial
MPYLDFEQTFSDEFIDKLRSLRNSIKPDSEPTAAELGARITHAARSGGGFTGRDFENIMGRNDLLPVNYLTRGVMATAAVGRVDVPEEFGGNGSWGTGFLISPRLMITNNHVINSPEAARRAAIEFGYERDANGRFKTSRRFRLDPDLAFITSDKNQLDYTLVALMPESDDRSARIDEFGFLRLEPGIHKVRAGEFVTIIQHPNGEEKFIAIRENKVLQIGAGQAGFGQDFLWYASDTAPGSSGAPAFNDNWQVVAVHHRGVPVIKKDNGATLYQRTSGDWIAEDEAKALPADLLRWEGNEGVRVSSIVGNIRQQQQQAANASSLVKDLLDDIDGIRPMSGRNERVSIVSPMATPSSIATSTGADEFLEARRTQTQVHAIEHFAGRKGYEPNFLGRVIPLPTLTDRALRFGSIAPVSGTQDNVLRYEHFSIVFNATRRLAFFTAVNIDGSQSVNLGRDDAWYFDGRLPQNLQVGNDFYSNEPGGNYFDRGHLVRRLDPVWGDPATAARANEDSFHWTNCSPQYYAFNQGATLWQGLENFILTNTDQDDLKASVFTGPLFRDEDELHRGVKIPQAFWKLVAVVDGANRLYTSAYIVSQKQFATNIPFERLPVGNFNNFQVSIARLEALTGLAFGNAVRAADVIKGDPTDRPLRSLADIRHPRRSSTSTSGFGQFESFEAFLESYSKSQAIADKLEEPEIGLEARRTKMRKRRERDVVEIGVTVVEYLGIDNNGGDRHQQMILNVTKVIEGDPDIENDLQRVINGSERVFLSVRFGDRMGLPTSVPGIENGSTLRVRGEWITKDRAYSHGGEKLSVIHFTHHPLGFICVAEQCWQ